VRLAVRTEYPWRGRVEVEVLDAPETEWTLSLRVPGWCGSATLDGAPVPAGRVDRRRSWSAGDVVVLALETPIRITEPDPRIDAVRGCVAIERGPLVYCVESADIHPRWELEDLRWDPRLPPAETARPDIGDDVVGVALAVVGPDATGGPAGLTAGAVPYFAWGNRSNGAMRVWLPR